ncbi:MAG: 50S ribosomal protein L29 [Bdellovibrionota bacterium]
MELQKLSIADITGYDMARLVEVENEIRRELAMQRMDVYAAQGQFAAKKKALKRNLARVLTVKNQKREKTSA